MFPSFHIPPLLAYRLHAARRPVLSPGLRQACLSFRGRTPSLPNYRHALFFKPLLPCLRPLHPCAKFLNLCRPPRVAFAVSPPTISCKTVVTPSDVDVVVVTDTAVRSARCRSAASSVPAHAASSHRAHCIPPLCTALALSLPPPLHLPTLPSRRLLCLCCRHLCLHLLSLPPLPSSRLS